MNVTLYEEDCIEDLDAAISAIKERHALRLASKRSQVAGFRETLTKNSPVSLKSLRRFVLSAYPSTAKPCVVPWSATCRNWLGRAFLALQ